jgi:hypothetical protein
MESTEVVRLLLFGIMSVSFVKHLLGFHFPWEVCQCCGKKYGEHTHEN